ncbi:hypothetical protein CVT24_009613 [Panaeolus cyanescens]|uniref:HMG box domain-containing protein n=1 Tax=Panaeolus cyanescens TaxID=181874 RepID=A0A409YA36_9AGAR|nr:hypothetical protein CVT24_009613 [Panaeolus cyanescens]
MSDNQTQQSSASPSSSSTSTVTTIAIKSTSPEDIYEAIIASDLFKLPSPPTTATFGDLAEFKDKKGKIRRPSNSWVLFLSSVTKVLKSQSFVDTEGEAVMLKSIGRSTVISMLWEALEEEEKNQWTLAAQELKDLHEVLYPEYKFRPEKKRGGAQVTSLAPLPPKARRNKEKAVRGVSVALSSTYSDGAGSSTTTSTPEFIEGPSVQPQELSAPQSWYSSTSSLDTSGYSQLQSSSSTPIPDFGFVEPSSNALTEPFAGGLPSAPSNFDIDPCFYMDPWAWSASTSNSPVSGLSGTYTHDIPFDPDFALLEELTGEPWTSCTPVPPTDDEEAFGRWLRAFQ